MLNNWIHDIIRYTSRLDPQQWLLVLAGVVIVGFLCLRGFGSRSGY
jgi:hypothetical protein